MSELRKFLFEGLPVRGAVVRIDDAWQEMLQRRREGVSAASGEEAASHAAALLPAVNELLGEMTAAVALLHSTVKFDGALILQVLGDGPLKLAVAEIQADMAVRATAKVRGEVPPLGGINVLCNASGQGRCAITLDLPDRQPGQQPYQGIVPLSDARGMPFEHLSEVIEGYMRQSEQLPTCVALAADEHCAAGLLVQRLPVQGEHNLGEAQQEGMDEHFNRIAMLAASLRRDELLKLGVEDILHRLFWQEQLRLLERSHPYFRCTCSHERVARMLRGLGSDEVNSILSEQGRIEVHCDFCGAGYVFDPVDARRLFVSGQNQPPTGDLLH